jgi:hypothetical protein
MGGFGSGRWGLHTRADTVESCRFLDANRWMREGILKADVWHGGSWAWFRDAAKTEHTASIGYEVNTFDTPPWVRLFYTLTRTGGAVDYRVGLVTTRPHFGGLRWWFLCPLSVNGRTCGRRVAKLYLDGRYFGCRQCHGLTYTSCQESHKLDGLYRAMAQNLGWEEADVRRGMRALAKRHQR